MSLSKTVLLIPVLVAAIGQVPALAQMSSSNIDPGYQAVMSRAGGESYVRQEPVESGSGGSECYDASYSDYWYGSAYGYSSAASSDAEENPGEEEWRRWNPSRKRDSLSRSGPPDRKHGAIRANSGQRQQSAL